MGVWHLTSRHGWPMAAHQRIAKAATPALGRGQAARSACPRATGMLSGGWARPRRSSQAARRSWPDSPAPRLLSTLLLEVFLSNRAQGKHEASRQAHRLMRQTRAQGRQGAGWSAAPSAEAQWMPPSGAARCPTGRSCRTRLLPGPARAPRQQTCTWARVSVAHMDGGLPALQMLPSQPGLSWASVRKILAGHSHLMSHTCVT